MGTTSGGTPLMYEANDGVVSVASQICLKGPDYHWVDLSHFEVLIADPVTDLAHDFLFSNGRPWLDFSPTSQSDSVAVLKAADHAGGVASSAPATSSS